jgi:uncharacterized protein (DUF433 family)
MASIPGHPHVSADVGICGGKPCLTGTRIRVLDILEMMAGGMTVEDILEDYEQLTDEAVRGALAYAAESQRHPVVVLG